MKKINKVFSFIWSKLRHNWGLKLLSFFFAVLLWNFVITGTDPIVTRSFEELPVTVYGDKQLSENDLALENSISSYIEPAKVTVEIKRSQSSELDKNDISVRVELASITATGTYEIKLFADATNGVVSKIVPESITVNVDEKVSRIIPIICSVYNETPENYYKGALSISPNSIQVTGAKSIIDKIKSANLSIDLSEMTESISQTMNYDFKNSDGDVVEASALTISTDAVLLEMDITPIKQLYIVPGVLGEDLIAEGYEVVRREVQPETIEVTGTPTALEGVVSATTESINLDGLSENTHVQGLKILLPEGLSIIGGIETADVLIVIQEKMAVAQFEGIEIELRNMPDELSAVDFIGVVDATILAPVNTIDDIRLSHITLYIDLTDALAGENTLQILYETPEKYRIADIVLSQDNVTVILE